MLAPDCPINVNSANCLNPRISTKVTRIRHINTLKESTPFLEEFQIGIEPDLVKKYPICWCSPRVTSLTNANIFICQSTKEGLQTLSITHDSSAVNLSVKNMYFYEDVGRLRHCNGSPNVPVFLIPAESFCCIRELLLAVASFCCMRELLLYSWASSGC